jgi:hypothetical protein
MWRDGPHKNIRYCEKFSYNLLEDFSRKTCMVGHLLDLAVDGRILQERENMLIKFGIKKSYYFYMFVSQNN